MRIGVIRRITKEAIQNSKDVPKWFESVLDPLNDFIEQAGQALKGKLTIADNFSSLVVTRTFSSGVELEINPTVSSSGVRASGLLVLSTGGLRVESWGWRYLSNGNIGVTISFVTGTSADCKIAILLE